MSDQGSPGSPCVCLCFNPVCASRCPILSSWCLYIMFHLLSSSELKSAGSSVQVLYLCGRAEVRTVTAAGTDRCDIALIWLVSGSSLRHQFQPPSMRDAHATRAERGCSVPILSSVSSSQVEVLLHRKYTPG